MHASFLYLTWWCNPVKREVLQSKSDRGVSTASNRHLALSLFYPEKKLKNIQTASKSSLIWQTLSLALHTAREQGELTPPVVVLVKYVLLVTTVAPHPTDM